MLISSYSSEFNTFLHSTENTVSEILSAYTTLFSNPDVKSICSIGVDKNTLSPSAIISAQSALLNFSIQHSNYYNIFLINRSGNFIVTSTGVYEPDYFFNNICSFDDYNLSYWLNYAPKSTQFDTLNPTYSTYNENQKQRTIPVVIPVSNSNIAALAVFNINLDSIYDNFASYSFTENAEVFILDNEDSDNELGDGIKLSDISASSTNTYYNISKIKASGKNYLILSSLERSNIFGCRYVVKIPYSDINSLTLKNINQLPILALIILALYLAYIFWGSKRFSAPWIGLADKLSCFNNTEATANDIIRNVDLAVTNLIDKNSSLSHNLSVSLSHGKQKYLTELLNNPATLSDENMNRLIFEKDYFVSVIIKIVFTKPMDEQFLSTEQLSTKLYESIESLFTVHFQIFPLRGTNNTYTLILNTDSQNNTDVLNEIQNQISASFSTESTYTSIYMGYGNTYQGIDGLRISHQEALSEFFEKIDSDKVRIYNHMNMSQYSLNLHYENILINHMLSGNGQSAIDFVNNIFLTYADKPDHIKKQIYNDLIRIMRKVCMLKNLNISDFFDDSGYDLSDNLEKHTDESILTYIVNIICKIDEASTHGATKSNSVEIIEYINENYMKDICLEDLAGEFHSTPKYISKILKQQLGIPFKMYLTQLKMNKAEELLRDKSIPVTEIGKMVGFINHSSFIRTFKQKNGISPTEYRKLYTKNNS